MFPTRFEKVAAFLAQQNIDINPIVHDIHVGNFAGWPVKVLWVVLGLTSLLLFVTGFLMWWNRIRRPAPQTVPTPATSGAYSGVTVEP